MTGGEGRGEISPGHPRGGPARAGRADPANVDFAGILDTIDVPILVVGVDCTLIRFNRAASDAFDLAPPDLGRRTSAVAALAGAADLDKLCAQVIAGDTPARRDVKIGDRHFLLRAAPYAGGTGAAVGAVLTFTNVTAFRASLEQAVYEREYTKAILNCVNNPLVVLDAQLRVQSANRAFYTMFGASRETTRGVPLSELGGDDWKTSKLWTSLAEILAENSDFELLEIERDFPVLGRRTVLLDARRLSRAADASVLLAFHDITERKRAEATLQESERRFREMVDALPVAVYTTDAEGRLTHFNPAAVEFAGRTPELGADHWCVTWKLYRTDGTPLPPRESPMAIALEEKRPIRGTQGIAERPDGERRWFEPYPTPLFDAAGRLSGGVNMMLDVTERKRAAEALQDADRRKDEFLALLAHELRNPLAPIRTGLELIRLSGDTPQSVGRVRLMMERQVGQMVRLIDDLLDVSRIASGKIVLQRAPSSLAELVQSAIEAHRTAIEAANIDLTLDLPEPACVVDVDPTRLVQVLSNVLHNASKFTPAHGKIHIAVDVRADEDPPHAIITVSDTGIGISNELLPRVFELFVQAEPAARRVHGGLGLGLALARQLIEMHGGEIAARSDGPGQGTAVTIKVPMGAAVAALQSAPRADLPRVASRVVIVDDNRDAAQTTAMLVEQLGGSARTAYDGASGLAAIREFQPDFVFLDIGMPGMDGYETCRRIREQPARRHVVVVAVTGWGQAHDKQRALDAGFDAHLTKPVDPRALVRLMARAVRPHGG